MDHTVGRTRFFILSSTLYHHVVSFLILVLLVSSPAYISFIYTWSCCVWCLNKVYDEKYTFYLRLGSWSNEKMRTREGNLPALSEIHKVSVQYWMQSGKCPYGASSATRHSFFWPSSFPLLRVKLSSQRSLLLYPLRRLFLRYSSGSSRSFPRWCLVELLPPPHLPECLAVESEKKLERERKRDADFYVARTASLATIPCCRLFM